MATEIRSQSDPIANLAVNPQEFDFFQAVRLLQHSGIKPHFCNDNTLHFAVNSITKVETINDQVTLCLSFMGLTGSQGVLPEHFTELLLQRFEQKDTTLADFLDIFNHRVLTLFYEVWQRHQLTLSRQTTRAEALELLYALSGHPKALQGHPALSQDNQIHYAGLLASQVRSSAGLRAILQDHFELPIVIESYIGEWLAISAEQSTRLQGRDAYNRLGMDTILGRRVWHVQNRYRVQVGPLNYLQFQRLLPNGDWLQAMEKIIEFYVGIEFRFDCSLMLPSQEIPSCELRQTAALQLGWNTWLKARHPSGIVTVTPRKSPFQFH